MSFCLEDGTPLISAPTSSYDPAATIKIPAARLTSDAPTEVMSSETHPVAQASPQATQPAPPQYSATAPPAPAKRKSGAALWILGAAVVLGLSAIAVALIMTRGGTNSSEVAQQTNQTGNTNPKANTSPSAESGGASAVNQAAYPVDAPTPAMTGDAASRTPTAKTPEQPTPTPKPTQTPRPTPAPEATPPPRRAPISGGVLNGKAISLPKPTYPAIARAARASGAVNVQVTIDESGRVISARAVSGHPLLQQAAVQAAYGARFSPTQISGQPVKVTGVVVYNFVAQ